MGGLLLLVGRAPISRPNTSPYAIVHLFGISEQVDYATIGGAVWGVRMQLRCDLWGVFPNVALCTARQRPSECQHQQCRRLLLRRSRRSLRHVRVIPCSRVNRWVGSCVNLHGHCAKSNDNHCREKVRYYSQASILIFFLYYAVQTPCP